MATIRDVAKATGLSLGTVSKALSNPDKVSRVNREKIQQAIAELGYRPNMLSQVFRNKHSKTVVVMIPDLSNQFFIKLISSFENSLQNKGYEALIANTRDCRKQEAKYIEMVATKLAAGIINLRPFDNNNSYAPTRGVSIVNAARSTFTPYPAAGIDNVQAAQALVEHLLALGHEKIAVIAGSHDHAHTRDRISGYQQALQDAGLEYDEHWIFDGDFTFSSGYLAASRIVQCPELPTAIFCLNDEMAIGAIKKLTEVGLRIPQDVSVAGFDDQPAAAFAIPALTTVRQPVEAIAEAAINLLFDIMTLAEPEPPMGKPDIILPHQVVVRESTARRQH